MDLIKTFGLLMLLLYLCPQAKAQENEITFNISKLKTPVLYPDTTKYMQRDHRYKFILRGASPSAIRSIEVSNGIALRKDSLVTVSIPEIPGYMPDSCLLTIRFAPTARLDTHTLVRKFYIPAVLKKPRTPYIPTGRFEVSWMHGKLTERYRLLTIIRSWRPYTIHHVTRGTLTGLTDPRLRYQYHGGPDSSYKSFDSIYVYLTADKKNQRYHIMGSALTPDVLQHFETMHTGDRMRFKVFYKDPGADIEHHENIYFKVSPINYVQRAT